MPKLATVLEDMSPVGVIGNAFGLWGDKGGKRSKDIDPGNTESQYGDASTNPQSKASELAYINSGMKGSVPAIGSSENAAGGQLATEWAKSVARRTGGRPIPMMKDGGKVKKTGPAILHEGETVLPTDKAKAAKLAKEHLKDTEMPEQDPVQKALAESKKVLKSADDFQAKAGGPIKKEPAKPAPAPAAPLKKKAPSEGLLGDTEGAAKGIKAKADNVAEYNAAQKASGGQELKPYKKGGKVSETGPAHLDKGETVLPADDKKKSEKLAIAHIGKKAGIMKKAMEEEDAEKAENETPAEEKAEGKKGEAAEKKESKGGKHTKYSRTEIEHHSNGSHTIKRHHRVKPAADGKVEPQKDPDTMAVPDDEALMAALQGGGEASEGAEPAQA